MDKNETILQIYLWLVTVIAIILLVLIGINGLFYWSIPLVLLTAACVLSEWFVLKLSQGDKLALSIIFILLALLFSPEDASPMQQAVGTVEVIAVGALLGYVLIHRPPVSQSFFYVAQYVVSASLAGGAFVLIGNLVPSWLETFHLPAVVAYVIVFSFASAAIVGFPNSRIVQGEKLPKADPLFVIVLAPISLIVFYFFQTRQFSFISMIVLALPLIGVLATFRAYVNIDTEHNQVTQLYEISQSFLAAMSQEETVQKVSEGIASAINDLVKCDACLIYARSGDLDEYLLANLKSGPHGPPAVTPNEGLLGRILEREQGEVVNDVALRSGRNSAELEWGARTAIMVYPLFAEQQQPVGLMVLVRYRRTFNAEDFYMVSIVANQAGVTLHNAQIYEESLQRADTDEKLDILTSAAFQQRAQSVMGRMSPDDSIALLLGDIDDFRLVNNKYLHSNGDRVLIGVAKLMKEAVSGVGFVGRRGGEEFVVLLRNADERAARSKAEEIRSSIQDYSFETDDGRIMRVTISIGVALCPRDAKDYSSLDTFADRASYLAKRTGKNRVWVYEEQKKKLGVDDVDALVSPEALTEGEFV